MKDNMKFFRDMANSALDDLHVTEELKEKTLKRCKTNYKTKIRIGMKPSFLAAICAALFAFTTTGYNNLFSKNISKKYNLSISTTEQKLEDIGNIIKNSIINPSSNEDDLKSDSTNNTKYSYNKNLNKDSENTKNTKDTKDIKENVTEDKSNQNLEKASQIKITNKESNESSEISEKNVIEENTTEATNDQNPQISTENKEINEKEDSTEKDQSKDKVSSLSEAPEVITISDAEKSFDSKVCVPSYIPDGFNLDSIDLPDNDSEKFVVMNYSSDKSHFTIRQDRNINFNNNVGEKIYIGAIRAYCVWVENCSEFRISCNKNSIQYVIQGNLSKDTLIKILTSIN
ncbi:DUF4367 domain-containing protein [Clostridium sp.]|jgi:hypothetical protein|uniref:DUF4367 domain-containing protein n=1 Tax=Clostridium sp. TaxID=1506 RepID=UPI003A5C4A31